MILLNFITSQQQQYYKSILVEDKQSFSLRLSYSFNCQSWYCDIQYKDKIINGIKVVYNDNLLGQYRNILPFGLRCVSDDFRDPFFIDDFSENRCFLIVLENGEI